MLTNSDIQKMVKVFATKEDLADLKDIMASKKDINKMYTSVDGYAKKADAYFQEMVMMSQTMRRHEKWLLQMAEKLKIKLEY